MRIKVEVYAKIPADFSMGLKEQWQVVCLYHFQYNDKHQRAVFAEQARAALEAGQMILTFRDEPKGERL